MQTHVATTPFGRRPMTLGQITTQMQARAAPPNAIVHKWEVFRNIRDARDILGTTDRALAVLEALLTFHPETALTAEASLIVFPSNERLIHRANGMSPATLRRHLAVLVGCGLLIRRDSPNGKRFARKGQGGEIEQAYGFDLSPIVARAEEFKELAVAAEAEKRAFRQVKEKLTICRRDVVKMIEAGLDEGVPADWRRFRQRYDAIVGRLPRTAPRQVLEAVLEDLEALWREVSNTLETFVQSQKSNANESHSERHIQNSNTDQTNEIEPAFQKSNEASGSTERPDNVRSLPKRELPLGIVLDACPAIVDFGRQGEIRSWRELIGAAELIRSMLGVSPSAWEEAKTAFGTEQAAVVLAAIYQRSDQIKSAGGYLRNLTERAKDGKFSVWPMVMALLRVKLTAKAKAS